MDAERPAALARDARGAIALITVFMAVFLVALLMHLVDLGMALLYRERLQEAADSAAFSAAVMHARGMNLIALVNMVMAALLAVLVALNLIEAVVVIAMAVVAACMACPICPVCVPAVGALGPLEAIRREVAAARDSVRPSVLSGLSMLNTAAHGLKRIIPLGAQLAVVQTTTEQYSPPARLGFAIPGRASLPVTDDAYSVLCGKAGKYVGKLIAHPFDSAGIPGFIVGAAVGAFESLAESNPAWFCAADGANAAPKPLRKKYTRHYPALPKSRACMEADPLDPGTAGLCEQAADEGRRSHPDERSGECHRGCDRALYDRRVALARTECDPGRDRTLKNYDWQERAITKHYIRRGGRLRWLPEADEVHPPRFRSDKAPPCMDAITGRYDWKHDPRDDDSGQPQPICSFVRDGAGTTQQEVIEVLRVFHCEGRAVREHAIADLSRDPDLGARDPSDRSRSSQTPVQGLTLGSDALQVRAVVLGSPRPSHGDLVRIAAWGRAATPSVSPLSLGTSLEQLQVAQAEYFFAGKPASPREWLWSMNWQARLRRFRMPSKQPAATEPVSPEAKVDDGFDLPAPSLDFNEGCANAGGTGAGLEGCDRVQTDLGALEKWIVH